MRVAVNTRFLLKDYLEGYGYFLQETLRRITQQHPEHEFIFIFDRTYDSQWVFSPNVTPVVCRPAARHPLLWKLWYDIKIPALLKKLHADVFVSADGFCSLTTKVPQCLVVHDLAFLHFPSFISRQHLFFYKRYTPKFLQKANSLATVSEFSKQDITEQYGIHEKRIQVIGNAARDVFRPATITEKLNVKNKYTGGRNYFIYTGAVHPRKNLLNLLKAFSVFKKMQQSNWKLVIAGRLAWKNESFIKNLKAYKHRDDVVITGHVQDDELALLTAGAYAMIYPSWWEGFGMPVLEAMRCEVPVITSSNSAMQEVAGDAALYADPAAFKDIADKMMQLYKDEAMRATLIEKGKLREQQFSWDRSADLLWQCIQQAVG